MPGATTTATTAAGVLLTTLMSLQGEGGDEGPLPVVRVNQDGGILSDNETTCEIYNFDRLFESDFCAAFVTSRTSKSIFTIGETRAMNCMAQAQTECILSPEVGLAVPIAFISQSNGIRSIVAPKILASYTPVVVRVSSPIDELRMRRATLNETIDVEFLSTDKLVVRETFGGEAAFCIQLLLRVFTPACLDLLL